MGMWAQRGLRPRAKAPTQRDRYDDDAAVTFSLRSPTLFETLRVTASARGRTASAASDTACFPAVMALACFSFKSESSR